MNTKTLSELEDKYIGKQGTPPRIAYEKEVSDLIDIPLIDHIVIGDKRYTSFKQKGLL